jgi:methionyl-tRNA formyltransferase
MSDPKIIFFGSPALVSDVLEILKKNFDVVAYIPDKDSYNNQNVDSLKKLDPDLFIVAAFGKIIPQKVLDIPKFGAINIHPSLLPKYRGATPVQAAILNGERVSGVSIIKMDAEMDHGPILAQKGIEILSDDTSASFYQRAFEKGANLLVKIIPDFLEGKLELMPQDHSQSSFCKLITKENGYFDINNPPSHEILDRMIRAYYPWPNVWTKWNGKIVKFLPGQQVQMEGKKATDLKSFLNGYSDFPIKEI